MIRFFTLPRKLPYLTLAEYHDGLRNGHAPLVRECRGFRENCLGYRQNHLLGVVELATGVLHDLPDPPHHNCSEFWYDDLDALLRSYNNDDYFRMLRPDEKRWSDSGTRLTFLAAERKVWEVDRAHDGEAFKVMVLRRIGGPGGFELVPRDDLGRLYPAFFGRCTRYLENEIVGELDFATAQVRDNPELRYSHLSELWFASRDDAAAAFRSDDGLRLVRSGRFPFCDPESTLALWGQERIIF